MTKRRISLGVINTFLIVIAAVVLYDNHSVEKGTPSLANLAPLSLSGHQRVLILAPHSDDETLGSAGLIQEALRAGMEVKVVIATNGDGSMSATMRDFHRIHPAHADYIRMGNLRQQESLAAMLELGIKPEQVIFLSYPDRGTARLWDTNWSEKNPYRSPYTGDIHSPYLLTYNPKSIYTGENYLSDLSDILSNYQPDLIIYPHPDDLHPDHWGLSAFTRLAIALLEQKNPSYHPDTFVYLVHRPDFPDPKGLLPLQNLLPPISLYNLDPSSWFRLGLDSQEVLQKSLAVYQYKSQLPLLYKLLVSFIRNNEVFAQLKTAEITDLAVGDPLKPDTWRDANGNLISPIQKDPVLDYFTRTAVADADLTAAYAVRTSQNTLVVCGQVRLKTDRFLVYGLHVLAVNQKGIVHQNFLNRGPSNAARVKLKGPYFCAEMRLADLGDPSMVFVGANVDELGVGILDQIAWQQVNIVPAPMLGK
jgi:LmbE family N-acetylglucosaminyl deacetylase